MNKQGQTKRRRRRRRNQPCESCRRAGGARSRARWRGRWLEYRIGGRIRTWGGCGHTSTCQSIASPRRWRPICETSRCRWICSWRCRRSGLCTPPSAAASTPPRRAAPPSSKGEGSVWGSTSCSDPNPPLPPPLHFDPSICLPYLLLLLLDGLI